MAILRPTKVFPAPGTPVIKQIDLRPFSFEKFMILAMAFDVWLRFIALASLLAISETS